MLVFVLALLLNLCCVRSSPAVRRAESTTIVIRTITFSTTPSAAATLGTFYWSNPQLNTSDGGYYPEWDVCPGEGSTCEQACGLGSVQCGSSEYQACYFPGLGDQCCFDIGVSCVEETTCAAFGETAFCCYSGETQDECGSLEEQNIQFATPLPNPTTSFSATGSSLINPSILTKDHTVTVAASPFSSTPTPASASTLTSTSKSSSAAAHMATSSASSSMTVGAKIGVGIGAPTAAIALGILGMFMWFRTKKRGRPEKPLTASPWEVDAQDSQLTPEEYGRKKNEKPPEDDEDDQNHEGGSEEPSAPPRSSYLSVSPLSRNRDSMAILSVNNPSASSPSVNYTPVPVSDLPELVVEGPPK